MSAGAFDLHRRSSRAVWAWCVVYTVLAPPAWRSRRREELRGHLWEAEQAGYQAARVVRAAVRGAASDLTGALGRGLPALIRSFGTSTTPYLVIAALFPIQFYVVSLIEDGPLSHALLRVGGIGGVTTLVAGAGVAALDRHRTRNRER
ncbi:MAG TPA: hypothetical protein VNC22_18875 [Sporichthya sp.]|nr:hypothetical protein [Sporichthya sp.]